MALKGTLSKRRQGKFTILEAPQLTEQEILDKVKEVRENHSELVQINNYIVNKHLSHIDREGFRDILGSAVPSFVVLLLSLFIDVSYVPFLGRVANNFANWLFPGAQLTNQNVEPVRFWWLPFAVYILFVLFAYFSNRSLKRQIRTKGPSEEIISRIVESYSGLVDAIGTAMPLLGAAILLISIKEGPTIFLGFSVPFEIKSIVILAMAKLYGSVFEVQGLQFQAITEEVSQFEKEYTFYNDSKNHLELAETISEANEELVSNLISGGGLKGISKEDAEQIFKFIKYTHETNEAFTKNVLVMKNAITELSNIKLFDSTVISQINNTVATLTNLATIVQKTAEYSNVLKENVAALERFAQQINNIKLPDEKILLELQRTSKIINETVNSLKDSNALKGLDNLVYIAGKR